MKKLYCFVTALLLVLTLSSQEAAGETAQKDQNIKASPGSLETLVKKIRSLERRRDQLILQLNEGNDSLISLEATVNHLKAENQDLAGRVKALQTSVSSLIASSETDSLNLDGRMTLIEITADTLELKNRDLAEEETELETRAARLQIQETNLENWTIGYRAFFDHVTVEPNDINGLEGPHVIFTGVNVHVRSGSGRTDDAGSGSGNLIVGYNEDLFGNPRTGSHNLVVGAGHGYSSCGGFVAGFGNTISGRYAAVSGGAENAASGNVSSVSGDRWLEAVGNYSCMPRYDLSQ